MKLIILLDGSKNELEAIEHLTQEKYKTSFLDVCTRGSDCEYHCMHEAIDNFSATDGELLVIRYSGDLEVTQELGDESSEMIIPVAFKGNTHCSLNYEKFENLVSTFI